MNRITDSFGGGGVVAAPAPSAHQASASHRPSAAARHVGPDDDAAGVPGRFRSFAGSLREELAPRTLLEQVVAERVILAAWRLHAATIAEADGLELTSPRRSLRAERELG